MSIAKNFFYSSLLSASSYIFPLITFPYVARILGVEGIGICEYASSIISYLGIIASMGINIVGIREIAAAKSNKEKLDVTFSSLFVLTLLFTLLAVSILLVFVFFIPSFKDYQLLLTIGMISLISSSLQINWFFAGIEDFAFITKRALVIQCIYVALVFLFVRTKDDYVAYFTLSAVTGVLTAIINQIYAHKFVAFKLVGINLKPYIRPYVILGIYVMITSMYTTLSTTILGFITTPKDVGYYSTAMIIFGIVLSLYTAYSNVIMPRVSSYAANRQEENFNSLVKNSIDILVMFSIPIILFCFIFTPEIIYILSGTGYEGAILPMRTILPVLIIVGLEQVYIMQVLMPRKRDKEIFINSCFGAIVGVGINILLTPFLASEGTALSMCFSHVAVFLSALCFVNRLFKIRLPLMKVVLKSFLYIPLTGVFHVIILFVDMPIFRLIIGCLALLIYVYIDNVFISKERLFIDSVEKVKFLLCRVFPK